MEKQDQSQDDVRSGQTPVDFSDQFPEQPNFWSHIPLKKDYTKYEDWMGQDLINKGKSLGIHGIDAMTRVDLIKAIRESE